MHFLICVNGYKNKEGCKFTKCWHHARKFHVWEFLIPDVGKQEGIFPKNHVLGAVLPFVRCSLFWATQKSTVTDRFRKGIQCLEWHRKGRGRRRATNGENNTRTIPISTNSHIFTCLSQSKSNSLPVLTGLEGKPKEKTLCLCTRGTGRVKKKEGRNYAKSRFTCLAFLLY